MVLIQNASAFLQRNGQPWRKYLVDFDHGIIPIPIDIYLPISLFCISMDIQW